MHLPDQIAAQLTEMIVTGALAPGSALPTEAALSETLMVSRPVIREAIRTLHSRGMVNVRQGVGGFVNPIEQWRLAEPLALLVRVDTEGLAEWLEVRHTLEVSAVALAAARAAPAEVAELVGPMERMERGGGASPTDYAQADIAFHLRIAVAAHNRALTTLMRPILQPLHGRIMAVLSWPSTAEWSNRQHRRIYAAIAARDPDAACRAMEEHLAHVAGEVERLRRAEPTLEPATGTAGAEQPPKPGRRRGGGRRAGAGA